MVGGEWTLRETLTSEYHKSYVIIRSPTDKLSGHALSSLKTIRLEVYGTHRARYIERKDNIYTLSVTVTMARCRLRTSQYHHGKGYSHKSQDKGQMTQVDTPRGTCTIERLKCGYLHRGMTRPASPDVPCHVQGYDYQQKE